MSDTSIWVPGPRPAWVRALNRLGDPRWISLEPNQLLDQVIAKTGLDDFGGDSWREGYDVFLRALEEEASLNLIGRVLARSDIENWLENRLLLTEAARRAPSIREVNIESPLFITGLPRTGTSILHELLGQDPSARTPLAWEVRYPCGDALAAGSSDPRIPQADEEIRLWCEIVPEYDRLHELGAEIPVECIQITAHDFRSDELSGRHLVPSYAGWLAGADMRPAYAFHKQMLQHLQHGQHERRGQGTEPHKRWVLKAPSHLGRLDALLAVYPDARIVWTHRDPLTVMASVASILFSTAWVRSDAVDAEQVLQWFTGETCQMLIDAAEAVRSHVDPAHFHDVCYADLMEAPRETLAGIYTHFGMPLSPEAESAMQAYLDARPRARHGAHRYDFSNTGFDPATERERFRDYQNRYAVVSEG